MTVRVDLLLKLADLLDNLPPERFNYGVWVGEDWGGKPDLSCGTTACALGWATTMPECQALGLKLNHGGPTIDGYDALTSAKRLFGIEFEEAKFLFLPLPDGCLSDSSILPSSATAKEVAAHIRAFCEKKSPTLPHERYAAARGED